MRGAPSEPRSKANSEYKGRWPWAASLATRAVFRWDQNHLFAMCRSTDAISPEGPQHDAKPRAVRLASYRGWCATRAHELPTQVRCLFMWNLIRQVAKERQRNHKLEERRRNLVPDLLPQSELQTDFTKLAQLSYHQRVWCSADIDLLTERSM